MRDENSCKMSAKPSILAVTSLYLVLYTTVITFSTIGCSGTGSWNTSHVSQALWRWQRRTPFAIMQDPESPRRRSWYGRTFRFYDPDYVAIHRLESIIYNLNNINDTVNYEYIWSLSKQIQLSGFGVLSNRIMKLYLTVCKHIVREQQVFYENPKARKLMHALGFQSITIHEYNALNLNDDEQINKMNITQSGIKKLKLLLLASRGSENYLTAVMNASNVFQQSADIQERAYNQISSTHSSAGVPVWIWSNFPWLAAPEFTYFPTHTFLLYFGALYEFLWTRYHHEFGFPDYDSMLLIGYDNKELVKKMDFVKYLMDRYRLRIHQKFSESKRETPRWMEQYAQQKEYSDTKLDASSRWTNSIQLMWMNVKMAQRSLCWALAEAVRLNELLMPDNEALTNQFMTEYVLAITEGGFLKIMWSKEIPFVRRIIRGLIDFNEPRDSGATFRLQEILRLICSARMG